MKKSLSVILSLIMIISAISFMPFSVFALDDPNEGVNPSVFQVPVDYDYENMYEDYEHGAGYIRVDDPEDENDGAEVVNLFHSDTVTSYKGISYDLASNTLTLDNVKGGKFEIQCDQMLHLKINVKGACTVKSFGFWETYPSFIGTGTLTITSPIEAASNANISEAEISPMEVAKTVTLKINGGECSGNFTVVSPNANYDASKIITYGGKASSNLNWNLNGTEGGPTEEWLQLTGIRARTVFSAKYLMKKKLYEGNDNYYVMSISHVGNEPYTYHYIEKLVNIDGYWVEMSDGSSYWNKDSLFEFYDKEEISSLPSSLVDGDGNITAYLSTQFDYGQAYMKDNKTFVLNTNGRYRNLIVNPSYPEESKYGNDYAPDVLMRVVKALPEQGVNLVRFEEEYNIPNSSNYEAAATFLNDYGYEKVFHTVNYPYNFYYQLSNSSITFSPATTDISKCTVSSISAKTYTGKAIKPAVTVKYAGKTLKSGTDYTVAYKDNVKAGTATVTITGKGDYSGTKKVTFKINKAKNTMTVKAKTKTVKYSTAKKKNVTVPKSNAMTVSKPQGTVTYTKSSGSSKITINKKTGKITVKKGISKGTYKVKIKVKAAGDTNYQSITKTITIKIIVK